MAVKTGFSSASTNFTINYKSTVNSTAGSEEYARAIWFKPITSGTSGQLVLQEGASVLLDQWSSGIDALASTLSNGYPTYQSPRTAQNQIITATMDGDGNYTLSGVPVYYPVCIIFVYKVRAKLFNPAFSISWSSLSGGSSSPVSGQGLPTGGNAGAYLRKRSVSDYDTEWIVPSFLNSNGTVPLTADWNAGAARTISVGKVEAKSFQSTASGILERTNGVISSVIKNDGTVVTINRTNGVITSINSGSKLISFIRDESGKITGWTVA